MNTTINHIIVSTLVLISCATKAAELPSSRASKHTGPVLPLKPEPKNVLPERAIRVILGAQKANKVYESSRKYIATLLKEMHSSEETVNALSNSPEPRTLAKAQKEELRTQKEQHKALIALCPQERKAQFAATLRKERKATKERFRLQRLELGDHFKSCCTFADETRKMAEKALNSMKDIEETYDRIDQLRQRNNASDHKAYTESKRQRRQ